MEAETIQTLIHLTDNHVYHFTFAIGQRVLLREIIEIIFYAIFATGEGHENIRNLAKHTLQFFKDSFFFETFCSSGIKKSCIKKY